ncbi:hypothetical protein RRG08_001655 [Elysia crispata]|uniref:Uncharacterized protein n=1 Tax=Elysia crispata TaxID=231223 RepID=A0AAE1AKL9_9GAST|nr:hypothetical protein RRG08_001655 [Elysia crispata]
MRRAVSCPNLQSCNNGRSAMTACLRYRSRYFSHSHQSNSASCQNKQNSSQRGVCATSPATRPRLTVQLCKPGSSVQSDHACAVFLESTRRVIASLDDRTACANDWRAVVP